MGTTGDDDMDVGLALTAVSDGGPGEALRAVMVLRRVADSLEADHVGRARRDGWTWAEIGDALGVSRQAVHKKYGRGS